MWGIKNLRFVRKDKPLKTRQRRRLVNAVDPPVADFTVNDLIPEWGETVTFTDTSTNTPTSWSWSYTDPDSVVVVFSTAQNPTLLVEKVGDWTIALTATNDGGFDTETKINFIAVANRPEVKTYVEGVFDNGGLLVDVIYTQAQIENIANRFDRDAAVTNSYRSKIVHLEICVFGADAAAKMVPFYFNLDGSVTVIGNYPITNVGFVDANCLEGGGRIGNALTKFTRTGIIPNAVAEISLNSVGVFIWSNTNDAVGWDIGCTDLATSYLGLIMNSAGDNNSCVNDSGTNDGPVITTGLFGAVRTGAASTNVYSNDTVTPTAKPSSSENGIEITGHGLGIGPGSVIILTAREQYLQMITTGTFNDTDYANFKSDFETLLTAMGL